METDIKSVIVLVENESQQNNFIKHWNHQSAGMERKTAKIIKVNNGLTVIPAEAIIKGSSDKWEFDFIFMELGSGNELLSRIIGTTKNLIHPSIPKNILLVGQKTHFKKCLSVDYGQYFFSDSLGWIMAPFSLDYERLIQEMTTVFYKRYAYEIEKGGVLYNATKACLR